MDRVFTKTGAGDDAEEAKARAAEAAKKKEMSKSKVSLSYRLTFWLKTFQKDELNLMLSLYFEVT